jgi:hypothetical protein
MTDPAERTTLATAIIRATAERIYQPAPESGPG